MRDKVAIVTGGGRGLGRAFARALAAKGAAVVIAEIDGRSADQVAKEITDAAGKAYAVETDVSDAWKGFEELMDDESAKRYCSQK